MSNFDSPSSYNERDRIKVLNAYQLEGPNPEAEFDYIVQQAADIFEVSTALVSFVEEDRQFFKARIGFPTCSTPRDIAFCAHALCSDDILVVPDARTDARFCANPLVTGEPFVRFYAGAPIIARGGQRLGTVCIIDSRPRPPLTDREARILHGLARIVVHQLERRQLALMSRAAISMAAATPDAIVCSDDGGLITFWNAAAEKTFGFSRDEALGTPVTRLVPDEEMVHFQPQVTLPEARIVGCEALIRWRHPVHGLLSPAMFLPVLEASEIAIDVGRWIVRSACSFAADLAARGFPITVGVNLFAAQLRDRGFHDDVVAALADTGLPSDLLELEITETTMLGLDHAAIEPLRALRARGVGIAFDDYGTGYASLGLLKRYPLTRLKIDREFVRALETDPDDGAIVRVVIALGASLNLHVIAEGIETVEQSSVLHGYGCLQAQGYRFGKPMPSSEFASRLTATFHGVAA